VIKVSEKMSLEKKIEEKLNESLKNKDKTVFPTLRLILSAIKDFKIASKVREGSLKDQEVISILKKMNKQRNDSCEAYKKAGRDDLLKKEQDEITIINNFLPKQMNEEETKKICQKAIESVGATSVKDMGKIMGVLKKEYGDVLDFSKVSNLIKEILK
tara:strand:- start:1494 stop:1967 length:474 start_codon:yes stop_codon:yes gene_type:complete